jgi:phospholipase C
LRIQGERIALLIGTCVAITVFLTNMAAIGVVPNTGTPAANPISHIVIIVQENHAFDNMFGAYPGLNPAYSVLGPDTFCDPIQLSNPNNCVKPWNGDSKSSTIQKADLGHSWNESHLALNGGAMNGFVSAQSRHGSAANYSMAYYTGLTIPSYWDFASYFGLGANFFSSELSYSYPNHLYLVAASSGGCMQCKPSNDLTFPQIATELTQNGVTWNYFAGNWNDKNDCKAISSGGVGYLNVLPDFPAVQLSSSTCKDIKNLNDLSKDIDAGTLPNVSWVTPLASNSDHPGPAATLPVGQEYITGLIDGIESHQALWQSTVIFVTWDDFGGYSDHVLPAKPDTYGYGFRVPLLVISPYVKNGSIFYGPSMGVQEDFSAFLSTMEAKWTLPSLTARDASDASLFYMLNFTQPPRPPLFLPTNQLPPYPLSSCPSKLCNSTGIAHTFHLPQYNMSNEQDSPD